MMNHHSNICVRHGHVGRMLFAATLLLLCSCQRQEPIRLNGQAQGTYYTIIYYDAQQRNLQPQIDSLLMEFDRSASLWVDSSLLRRINAGLTDTLNSTLCALFKQSAYVHDLTSGAFDIRVGRLVQAWGFSFRQRQEPDSLELQHLLALCQQPYEVLYADRRIVKPEGLEFDFNAIAQGYSADLVGDYLAGLGINSYLVDIGGEVVAHGQKPDGQPWRVGIERPAADSLAIPEVELAIALHDASVVTSGNYRKYYVKEGVRYSHTISPTTGRPVQHSLLSVSVVTDASWYADALCTAFMVMGLDEAKHFIATHEPDLPAFFIYDDHGSLRTYTTPSFSKLIVK